ncbi:AAA family ATPase [Hyalangium versicolor]|uniref:AAA family ATPase n=1 Tax=Hyalangium versicolor TaxID=2861190 RepID=UPI001CCC59C8|nr:ATP-binding protein [Hyalangium versicolor]
MIRKVSFRNFKAYRSLDVELEPFTVLVGPNASGKTTLLDGLRFISQFGGMMETPDIVERYPQEELQSYGVSAPVELTISGRWKDTEGMARVSSKPGVLARDNGHVSLLFSISGQWNEKSFPPPKDEGQPVYDPPLHEFRRALTSTAVLRFESRKLAEASYSEEPVPEIQSDGSGLASVLAHLKLSQDEIFEEIEQALKQVVPAVRRIRIDRAIVANAPDGTHRSDKLPSKLWGNQVVLDMKGAKGVPATAAGEGTLMVLGLLTVLRGPARPRLVLLDDVELALHPAAQAKLIEVLRSIQKRDPELQIVATSHSPFILNYLDPKEVRMTFLAENGFARCEKLTAHPEFEKWKDLMSPGEFWSTVGESWLEKAGDASASE